MTAEQLSRHDMELLIRFKYEKFIKNIKKYSDATYQLKAKYLKMHHSIYTKRLKVANK